MKDLIMIHNRAKFHLDSICGSQVINFQMYLGPWSSHELGHFGGLLGHKLPKIASILLKLAPEVVLNERNTMLKFLVETPIFAEATRLQTLNLFFVLAQL